MTVHAVSDERHADFAIDEEFSVEVGGPRKARKARKRADLVVRDGVMVEATVVRHGRKFVFWKSARDYVVAVEFEHDGAREQSEPLSGIAGVYGEQRSVALVPPYTRFAPLCHEATGRSTVGYSAGFGKRIVNTVFGRRDKSIDPLSWWTSPVTSWRPRPLAFSRTIASGTGVPVLETSSR